MELTPLAVDATLRTDVVEGVLRKLKDHYVFPEVATHMEEAIRRRLQGGEYDGMTDPAELCDVVTTHLREVSRDKHLRVVYSAEPRPMRESDEPTLEEIAEWNDFGRLQNFGFQKVARLDGNVGYLELRGFFAAAAPGAGEAAAAAMTLLAHTSALIVDLRHNGGGDPAMIALLSSYLFDRQVHLNSLYWRTGDQTQQFWTLPYVPGARFGGEKPIYVLTSNFTFSGAEEFTYNLQTLKRATIIGETTGGGAHPGGSYRITPHFAVSVPSGRAINPISGTNWEGTGVTPDIAVPQDEAYQVAYRAALRAVLEAAGEEPTGPRKLVVEEARKALAELEQAHGSPA